MFWNRIHPDDIPRWLAQGETGKLIQALRYKRRHLEQSAIREQAAQALGQLADVQALKPLKKALKDPAREVRRAAVIALGHIGHHQAAAALVRLYKTTTGNNLREVITQALGNIGGRRAGKFLIRSLKASKAPAWEMRQAAAKALGNMRYQPALKPLGRRLLKEHDDVVRCAMAEALGNIGDPRALRYLRQADTASPLVGGAVRHAIGRLASLQSRTPPAPTTKKPLWRRVAGLWRRVAGLWRRVAGLWRRVAGLGARL